MTAHHDKHGSTPAAWTAVTIIMVAFLVGGIGVVVAQPWLFWVGVAWSSSASSSARSCR